MARCEPIGTIETPFAEPEEAPDQGEGTDAIGTISVAPEYQEGLHGLHPGMDLDVIWFADRAERSILRHEDRDVGVFALRTQHRPNPIGITTCEIVDITGSSIDVRGVDMLNGTPLLDLKPSLMADG